VHWLDQAASQLRDLDPRRDPEIFQLRLATGFANTARGAAAREDLDALFAGAVQRFPDYFSLYALRAWQLMPEWLGESGDHAAFLTKLLSGDPHPRLAQAALAFALMGTLQQATGTAMLAAEALPWDQIQAAFQNLERSYRPGSEALNALMVLAMVNGDRAAVARTADRLGDHWEAPWFHDEAQFAATVAWANDPDPALDSADR